MGKSRTWVPTLKLLSPAGIERLHEAALSILDRTGLNVHHDGVRRSLVEKGAIPGEGLRVRLPSRMVDEALRTAKRNVVVHDRAGNPVMPFGPHQIYFGTGSDLVYTLDSVTGQRRVSKLDDVAQAARLCDALPEIDFVMSFGLPHDVPKDDVEPQQYYAMLANTPKPVIMTSFSGRDALERMHAMACLIAGGDEAFRRRPNYILYGQFVSPLQHDPLALDRLVFCAEHEVPLIYIPTIMPGMSGPMTLAGSLALAAAESLAGLVMHQAQRPGAPFIFGACVSPLDMRTMRFPYGSPEWRINDLAMAELSRHYGLPVFGTGGATDGQRVDAQTGAEYATSLLVAALAGTNLIHDVGYLDAGLTGSLESLVLGAEQIRWVKHFLAGLPISDETLALDAMAEVGPGGHFLDHDHTLAHLRRTVWEPYMAVREGHDRWVASGAKGDETRARELARRLVESHQPVPIEPSLDAQLRRLCHLNS